MSELSRRAFLSTVSGGVAAVTAGSLLADKADIGAAMPTEGHVTDRPLPHNEAPRRGHYRPVIPGARNSAQIEADAKSMKVKIPDEFWAALKREGLIAKDAPTPQFG